MHLTQCLKPRKSSIKVAVVPAVIILVYYQPQELASLSFTSKGLTVGLGPFLYYLLFRIFHRQCF